MSPTLRTFELTPPDDAAIAVVADGCTAASLVPHRRAGFTEGGRLERVGRTFDRWPGTSLPQKTLA